MKYYIVSFFLIFSFIKGISQEIIEPVKKINTQEKIIAFTFDDGPIKGITLEIIKLFEENDGKATFFNIGNYGIQNKSLVDSIIIYNHEIGNHTIEHLKPSDEVNYDKLECEIVCFQEEYKKHFEYTPKIYRAPVLDFKTKTSSRKSDSIISEILVKLNLTPINAAITAKDFKMNLNSTIIYNNLVNKVFPGAIILCHERLHTLNALKKLLPELIKQGYKFVTVSNLIKENSLN
ncbi:peptidoglycan/xylan/chitin deacetylase (PgdA/CDA1 family) [Maribacter vaceletii]|uniref:Peptidoglycan/xylan/chitin deacetylase (PgdA/CDA1 family) n=1 Tax=Maribacter vaceletii TaxID=1206816 RepID=A0A495E7Q5_9FLAO|nr:polysaccharide deacetylase family protein [Maribacter vaceletii]RKR12975.1 peptidoglycan/xylan/chitin deacetylase (PgdA/CDA1 family) [Maribacter vaceletii]